MYNICYCCNVINANRNYHMFRKLHKKKYNSFISKIKTLPNYIRFQIVQYIYNVKDFNEYNDTLKQINRKIIYVELKRQIIFPRDTEKYYHCDICQFSNYYFMDFDMFRCFLNNYRFICTNCLVYISKTTNWYKFLRKYPGYDDKYHISNRDNAIDTAIINSVLNKCNVVTLHNIRNSNNKIKMDLNGIDKYTSFKTFLTYKDKMYTRELKQINSISIV